MRAVRIPLALGLAGLLTACSTLGVISEVTTPPTAYEIRAPLEVPDRRARPLDLIVEVPETSGAIATDLILIRPSPVEVSYLPGAQWTEEAPQMLQTALVEGLERTGAFRYVGRQPLGPGGDFALVWTIGDFHAAVSPVDGTAEVLIRTTIRIVREEDIAVTGTRTFTATAPAAGIDNAQIVAAYDAAGREVLGAAIDWIVTTSAIATP